ncbi:MAG TPA: hypothetical protein VK671_05325 [Mucilaginibacter sp.]|jgi:hypothetical protein|nr:hypothetical protein [Mucilaginibacter sp.]
MTTNSLLVKLFSLLFISAVLVSCKPHEPGTWKNEKIEAGAREDFHKLNDRVLEGLKENSRLKMDGLMSRDLIQDPGRLRLIELCSNHLKDGNYTLMDEYYVVHKDRGDKTLQSGSVGINNYSLKYNAETREMYMAFFIPKDIPNKYLISAIYCKYDYGWKITHLEVSPYTFNGKTAPELFDFAKDMYAKKYLLDALNDAQSAQACIEPCDGWKYQDESDIHEFAAKVIDEINKKYVYPFTLTQVPTRPRIFSIMTQKTPDGVYPQVYYMSTVKLKDVKGLQKENDNIKKVIGKLIPGIDKNKKYVYYDAFNEWPKFDRSVDRYEMVDKLK